jgi:two-component system response regulator VicR
LPPARKRHSEASRRRAPNHKNPPRARILLVEDHEPLAALRAAFLAQQGYQVACVRDGQKALRLLPGQSFDLVITDSELPHASGWEVASVAKRWRVPVILSSGWPVRLSPEQIAMRGVDLVAPKPCTLQHLLELVQTALARGVLRANEGNGVPDSSFRPAGAAAHPDGTKDLVQRGPAK